MYHRQKRKALSHDEVHDLVDAAFFADRLGKRLNTAITVHPKYLDAYPADVGIWLSTSLLNNLRTWCARSGFGYFALWVRESYQGDRHEHVHLLLYVPDTKRSALEGMLKRWLPGQDRVVDVRRLSFKKDRFGRSINGFVTYLLKQMTPQAWWSLEQRVRRETHCRYTGLPVAAVLGKRCGVSRTLSKTTRRAA